MTGLRLAVALDGFGAHPAAWRLSGTRPGALHEPTFHSGLIRLAEAGALDFVTLDEHVLGSPQPAGAPSTRPDPGLVLAHAAALTERIGLVLTSLTDDDPVRAAARVATLDHLSGGRAGWRPRVAGTEADRALLGTPAGDRRIVELFAETGEYVAAVDRLWSGADGGALTAPPGRGRPPVFALAHSAVPYSFAARHADIVSVTPFDTDGWTAIRAEVGEARDRAGRPPEDLLVFAELVVCLGASRQEARDRWQRLDELHGSPFRSDAHHFVGTPEELADHLGDWHAAGGLAGFRFRPAVLPHDLRLLVGEVVPLLRGRGLFRTGYTADGLRGHLGLDVATAH